MRDFFFDTADGEYILKTFDKLASHIEQHSVVGITTNPNAVSKVNCTTVNGLEKLVSDLALVLRDIRNDTAGLIYVQVPSTTLDSDSVVRWCNMISNWGNGDARIAVKLPHFAFHLGLTEHPDVAALYPNITGISDWGTTLKALSYPNVKYASIIPGRMDEVGIDSNKHLQMLYESIMLPHQGVITGSMRTIEGLKKAIKYGTVPTIGARVWDEIARLDCWDEFFKYWFLQTDDWSLYEYCPETTEKNIQLSRDFFAQMDKLGEPIHQDFITHKF